MQYVILIGSLIISVNAFAQLSASIADSSVVSCQGDCDGFITVTASSGVLPYSYLWNDQSSQKTATATGLCAMLYTVVVSDAVGDSVILSHQLKSMTSATQIDSVVITPADDSLTCNGSAQVFVSSPQQIVGYYWSNGSPTNQAINLCADTITVDIYDSMGCIIGWKGTIPILPVQTEIMRVDTKYPLAIYPNPFTSGTTIAIEGKQPVTQLRIYDTKGRFIGSEENLLNSTIILRRNNLPSGMYFVELIGVDGVISREKIIAQ